MISYLGFWGGQAGVSQKLFMSLILNCESADINATAKLASFPFTANRAQFMDFHMVFYNSTCHRHNHDLRRQCRTLTSTWP